MRLWIGATSSFGSLVTIVVDSIVSPFGDFQRAHRPAKPIGSPDFKTMRNGCLRPFGASGFFHS
jgi:hypothetical protein